MDNINLDPQQIQQMILLLQSMLPKQNTDNSEVSFEVKTKKSTKSSKTPKARKVSGDTKSSQPSRHNKFEDMPELNMHKEDIALDKKLSVLPPVPRARKFSKISVVCRVCGKKEDINPALLTDSIDRYKCNKCSTGAG